jgi:hypothetical protein
MTAVNVPSATSAQTPRPVTQGGTSITSLPGRHLAPLQRTAPAKPPNRPERAPASPGFNASVRSAPTGVRKGMKKPGAGSLHYTRGRPGWHRHGVEWRRRGQLPHQGPIAQEERPQKPRPPAKGRGKKAPVEQDLELVISVLTQGYISGFCPPGFVMSVQAMLPREQVGLCSTRAAVHVGLCRIVHDRDDGGEVTLLDGCQFERRLTLCVD